VPCVVLQCVAVDVTVALRVCKVLRIMSKRVLALYVVLQYVAVDVLQYVAVDTTASL